MELEARLRAFGALARRQSFTRAAEELGISQPAVSRHVAALEAEVGLPLVVRSSRGPSLTPPGAYLAGVVLRAESLLAQGGRGVAAFAPDRAGSLAVAASGTPGTYLLPPFLAVYRARHRAVEFTIDVSTSAAAVDAVRSHRAEIAIVGGLAAAPELDVEILLEDEVVVVGPADAPRRPGRAFLSSATWISREEGSATRDAVEAAWSNLGIVPAQRLELPSWEAVKLAVAAGAGIAAISRLGIEVEIAAGTLAVLDVRGWHLSRAISIVSGIGGRGSPAADAFVEELRAWTELRKTATHSRARDAW